MKVIDLKPTIRIERYTGHGQLGYWTVFIQGELAEVESYSSLFWNDIIKQAFKEVESLVYEDYNGVSENLCEFLGL